MPVSPLSPSLNGWRPVLLVVVVPGARCAALVALPYSREADRASAELVRRNPPCRLSYSQMLCSRSKSSIRADRLGVDEATAAQATRAALATLVQGMQANARDRAAEASLAEAMSQHARRISERGEPDVDSAETQDGARIVSHVFGDSEGQVVNQLGGLTGGSDLFKKLLPMLAPLVMGFLAKQFSSRRDGSDATTGDDGSSGFGDVLGGLLGGAGGSASGGGLSDLLGGLLGDSGSAGGGSLDDLLAACSVEVAADGPGWWS